MIVVIGVIKKVQDRSEVLSQDCFNAEIKPRILEEPERYEIPLRPEDGVQIERAAEAVEARLFDKGSRGRHDLRPAKGRDRPELGKAGLEFGQEFRRAAEGMWKATSAIGSHGFSCIVSRRLGKGGKGNQLIGHCCRLSSRR